MKPILISLLVGLCLGAGLSALIAPKLIAWYFEPPVEIGINCRPAVEWAMDRLQSAQLISGILGSVLAVVVFTWFRRVKKRNSLSI